MHTREAVEGLLGLRGDLRTPWACSTLPMWVVSVAPQGRGWDREGSNVYTREVVGGLLGPIGGSAAP